MVVPPSEPESQEEKQKSRGAVRYAKDEDVARAIKRISRDHLDLIKALAK